MYGYDNQAFSSELACKGTGKSGDLKITISIELRVSVILYKVIFDLDCLFCHLECSRGIYLSLWL